MSRTFHWPISSLVKTNLNQFMTDIVYSLINILFTHLHNDMFQHLQSPEAMIP